LTKKEKRRYILGSYFVIANKLQNYGDMYLKEINLTTKQWLFLAVLEKDFEDKNSYPSIGEIAYRIGTSHQNAKQIAVKLNEKGFIDFIRDKKDRRILRIKSIGKNKELWEKRSEKDDIELKNLFIDFKENELSEFVNFLIKFYKNILKRIDYLDIRRGDK
jgi:DNA-binding MarR family transcriptional regulator